MCKADGEILTYLKLLDGQDRRELAAKLLDYESVEKLEAQHGELTQEDLFTLVQEDNTMSTLGIR